MNELIKISVTKIGEQEINAVSARELYIGLGLALPHWAKWSRVNIDGNEFFSENKDWIGFTLEVNGNETTDYAITLEFAKHIAMQAKTEKSHEYRNYMLECERKSKGKSIAIRKPRNDYKSIALAHSQELIATQRKLLEEMALTKDLALQLGALEREAKAAYMQAAIERENNITPLPNSKARERAERKPWNGYE